MNNMKNISNIRIITRMRMVRLWNGKQKLASYPLPYSIAPVWNEGEMGIKSRPIS